jgi:hypothetical protein
MIPVICRLGFGSKNTGESAIHEQEQVEVCPDTIDHSIPLDRDIQ